MKPPRPHRPQQPTRDKENAHAAPILYHPVPAPVPPSTNPASPRSAAPLQRTVRNLLRQAEVAQSKSKLLDLSANPNLLQTLQAAAADPLLRNPLAQLFAALSVDYKAADRLAQAPFLSLLDNLLATPAPHPVVRHAASAIRNITAHSPNFARALARNADVVRRLIVVLRVPSQPDADTAEVAAALANFARAGLQCQAYARKHGALPALVDAAMATGDHTRFHACRAFAEYSLENKWLVLLIAEGCVGIMIRVLEHDADLEIVTEATRFLGNLATTKVGREAVLGSGGLDCVVARVLTLSDSSQLLDLRIDLLRTASNLCVNNKDAASKVIALSGLTVFIDAYALVSHPNVQTEAFRGLLIIAQATQATRAAVLREIGIKIRQDASHGRCVASLYDLLRRIKVEASAERSDDFPQTIADLGARSKHYLFRAGPLATTEQDDSTANSVPELKSPAVGAFRQSARLLSVQRPVLHRDRLEQERRHRPAPAAVVSPSATSDVSSPQSPIRRPMRPPPPHGAEVVRSSDRGPRGPSGVKGGPEPRAVSEPAFANGQQQHVDAIPRCRVIQASQRPQESPGQWVKAVLSAVCSAVSRSAAGPSSPMGTPSRDVGLPAGSGGASAFGGEKGTPNVDGAGADEDVYEIGVALGRGGFATVYLAKNLRNAELVAVKRFHPPNGTSLDVKRKAETSLRRAIKEQRIWDGLAHKNIVSYKGCFFGEQGELNLVAEYVPGWSLADHLSQISKFPEHMVACITVQIVAGLDYLHKCGVTHRDVKPANILVNPDGVIKITDFGVSSAVDVPTMTGNTLVGTPWYIAPEMIAGRPYGKSVDIWSLGCTVIELATGKRPYHNLRPHIAMFRMTQDRMPPIPKNISPMLRDFLKTCWVWDAAQRPTPAHLKRHPFLASVSRPEVTNLKNMTRKAI